MMGTKATLLLLWSIFIVDMDCVLLTKDSEYGCRLKPVACICVENGEEKLVYVEGNMIVDRDPLTEEVACMYSGPDEICANISCYYAEPQLLQSFHLLEDHGNHLGIPPKGIWGRWRRSFNKETCTVKRMPKAVVSCRSSEFGKVCEIKCIYGHAHMAEDGSSQKVKTIWCLYAENVWRPHGFSGCWPYMNCTLELVNYGKIKCTPQIYAGPVCDITCWHPTASSTGRYQCIRGHYTPPLPKCVSAKTERLINSPKFYMPKNVVTDRIMVTNTTMVMKRSTVSNRTMGMNRSTVSNRTMAMKRTTVANKNRAMKINYKKIE